ncbi:MAG: nagA [Arthrobacter sp.]|jgi:N-acetylglucosamine-6-phosphate deacetylase|nr:nagA [Arthrobacter sp.]
MSRPPIRPPAAPPRPDGRRLVHGTIVSDGARTPNAVLAVEGGRIAYAGPAARFENANFPGAEVSELPPGSLILPGLVDLHCHGAFGGDFPAGDEATSRRAVDLLHRSGTTTLLASLVTASPEDLLRGIAVHAALSAEGLLAGIHLEGPFLSPTRCGAQNPAFLREPEPGLLAELLAAASGTLATMTYAPELPGAADLVAALTRHGVIPSLGHTDCDGATASASLAAARQGLQAAGFDGVRARPTVTHLFNAMPPLHHRVPGAVGACLRSAAAGTAVVELIADGSHLDPFMVSTVFQLVGAGNIALVTDSMAAAGLPDGPFRLGPSAVTVRDGVATLDATGALAGGTATLLAVVARAVAAGVSLADAVRSATAVPAAVLGLAGEVGSLRRGLRADAVVVDAGLGLRKVMRNGQWLQNLENCPPRPLTLRN